MPQEDKGAMAQRYLNDKQSSGLVEDFSNPAPHNYCAPYFCCENEIKFILLY